MRLVIHAWRDLAHPQAGGSEHYVDQLATGLTERGHDVHLICGGPVGPRPYGVTDAGGTYSQYLRVPLLDRLVAREADLVLDVANGMTYFSPLWRRGPTVLLFHHLHTQQWPLSFAKPVAAMGSWLERTAMPRVYRRCLVVTVSESSAQDLERIGFGRDRIRVIPSPVSAPTLPAAVPRSAEPLFVAVGRLVPHKRIGRLLAMWSRVRPLVGGRLVVVGDGPERSQLEASSPEAVEFLGRVDEEEKHRLFAEAWMLVHAASHEGWGIVVIEAAMHGTPTLAFNVPGVRDAVRPGCTGMLADDEDGFVRAWIELANDAERRAALGRAAAAWASTFGLDGIVNQFESVAREAIERHAASRRRPR